MECAAANGPQFAPRSPRIMSTADTQAVLGAQSVWPATIAVMITSSEATPPTVAQVLDGAAVPGAVLVGSVNYTDTSTELQVRLPLDPGTAYDAYFALASLDTPAVVSPSVTKLQFSTTGGACCIVQQHENYSITWFLRVCGLCVATHVSFHFGACCCGSFCVVAGAVAPEFAAGTPSAVNTTGTGTMMRVALSSVGDVWWVVVAGETPSPSPTADDIKAGTAANGEQALAHGQVRIDSNNEDHFVAVDGLSASTTYTFYAVTASLEGVTGGVVDAVFSTTGTCIAVCVCAAHCDCACGEADKHALGLSLCVPCLVGKPCRMHEQLAIVKSARGRTGAYAPSLAVVAPRSAPARSQLLALPAHPCLSHNPATHLHAVTMVRYNTPCARRAVVPCRVGPCRVGPVVVLMFVCGRLRVCTSACMDIYVCVWVCVGVCVVLATWCLQRRVSLVPSSPRPPSASGPQATGRLALVCSLRR